MIHLRIYSVRAVLNETLRLFPPVPISTRESLTAPVKLPAPRARPSSPAAPITQEQAPKWSTDVHQSSSFVETCGDPLYMPGSTPIMLMPLLMQRNPDLWGPDADTFDPDRWLDSRAERFRTNPMIFMPFSAGPRIVSPKNQSQFKSFPVSLTC